MEHPADPQVRFLARLGAAMGAANYPVTLIRQMLDRASAAYGTSHEVVALPNSVQVTGPAPGGTATAAAHQDAELRFDQMFPLARLVSAAMRGAVSPTDGNDRLDRILARPAPYPPWLTVLGYGVWSTGLGLVLEPSPLNLLGAAALGLIVGVLAVAGQRFGQLGPLVPVTAAFVVATVSIAVVEHLELDHVGLRALIPPLAMFLPGAAITLAVIELTARDIVSGSARLIAGFVQLAQLAFGILIAAQLLGEDESRLSAEPLNKLGSWAPWLGVAVYALGVMLFFAPPRSFLPWLLAVCYAAFTAQFLGDLALGSYASGFAGGLVLTGCALMLSRRPGAPPAITMILPGFWLLVPGSMGLIGFAELFGADGDSALGVTFISMISVALGLQAGLVLWQLLRRARRRAG
ncbi:threonine/serine exporter family protein [Mycolicibacterium thermoresistibile]